MMSCTRYLFLNMIRFSTLFVFQYYLIFNIIYLYYIISVGRVFHTTPNVLHYKNKDKSGVMAVGHTFTIEPMICLGTYTTRTHTVSISCIAAVASVRTLIYVFSTNA